MGFAKSLWEQQQTQGFYFAGDKYVCADCFGDYAIRKFIDNNSEAQICNYCGANSSKPIAAHMDKVMAFILEGIESEWGDPDNEGVPYETAEGGYQGKVIDSYDLITDQIGDELEINSDNLIQDIIDSLVNRQWCQKNFWVLRPEETLIFSWEQFVKQVKHHTRYVFFRVDDESDDHWDRDTIATSKMLDELGRIVSKLGVIKILDAGTRLWRARIHGKDKSFNTAKDLGTVQLDDARYSNRMSPVGIPMFYGALDMLTALKETVEWREQEAKVATIAPWKTLRQMKILDLTALPEMPSLFDPIKRDLRPSVAFLRSFVADVSKPIIKDRQEHIEYVPTQIVTEYFRHIYRDTDGSRLKGIFYPSSRNSEGVACVLFIENENCCDTQEEAHTDKNTNTQKYLLLENKEIRIVPFQVKCTLNLTESSSYGS